MNNTVKQTPTGEVMAHFNLSDAEWDGLPGFVQQKLATVYYRHAAAPAMYEALKATLAYFMRSNQSHAPEVRVVRAALAQAEDKP